MLRQQKGKRTVFPCKRFVRAAFSDSGLKVFLVDIPEHIRVLFYGQLAHLQKGESFAQPRNGRGLYKMGHSKVLHLKRANARGWDLFYGRRKDIRSSLFEVEGCERNTCYAN